MYHSFVSVRFHCNVQFGLHLSEMILLESIYFQYPVMQDITWQITDVKNVNQELGVKQVLQVVLIVLVAKHLKLDLPLRVIARGVSVNFG